MIDIYVVGERGPEIQSIPSGTRINAFGLGGREIQSIPPGTRISASEMTPIHMDGKPHAEHPQAILDTCDKSMPHDMRFSAPTSCPPFCPTRMDTR